MINIREFIVAGRLGSIDENSNCYQIIQNFGEPDILEPARKSYPTMIVYGDIEFFLRHDRLITITLSLKNLKPNLPNTMTFKKSLKQEEKTILAIEKLLEQQELTWHKDKITSDEDESFIVYITERGIHLGFLNGILVRIAATYTESPQKFRN
jgi:hypothetical protein